MASSSLQCHMRLLVLVGCLSLYCSVATCVNAEDRDLRVDNAEYWEDVEEREDEETDEEREVYNMFGRGVENSVVFEIQKESFGPMVMGNPNVVLVNFYAPPCTRSRALRVVYEQAARLLKGTIPVTSINCDAHRDLCLAYEIKDFPTVMAFPPEIVENPYHEGKPWKAPVTLQNEPDENGYTGPKTPKEIAQFALQYLPDYVVPVTDRNYQQITAISSATALDFVMLFTSKRTASNLYKAVAANFYGKLDFGIVFEAEQQVFKQFKIKKTPALLVKDGRGKIVAFEGKHSHHAIAEFLSSFAGRAHEMQKQQMDRHPSMKKNDKKLKEDLEKKMEKLAKNLDEKTGKKATDQTKDEL